MCKKCRNNSYYKLDPDKHRNFLLERRYGISVDTYNKMYTIQKGCCAICGKHSTTFKKNLCVDHCHISGQVRALLCIDCNRNVGVYENYKDQIENYLNQIKKGGLSVS